MVRYIEIQLDGVFLLLCKSIGIEFSNNNRFLKFPSCTFNIFPVPSVSLIYFKLILYIEYIFCSLCIYFESPLYIEYIFSSPCILNIFLAPPCILHICLAPLVYWIYFYLPIKYIFSSPSILNIFLAPPVSIYKFGLSVCIQ